MYDEKPDRIVVKYGGKSLATPDLIKDAALAIKKEFEQGKGLAVVLSAFGNTTNELLNILKVVSQISRMKWDSVLSFGERISASIFSVALNEINVPNYCFDPSLKEWPIITDDKFGDASPLIKETKEAIKRYVEPILEHSVAIIPGFIGRDLDRNITTMGRGGSDLTAFILAKCLKACNIVKVTDVDGIYVDGKRVDEIKNDELKKLCNSENKEASYEIISSIIQPKAIQFLEKPTVCKVISHKFKNLQANGTLVIP